MLQRRLFGRAARQGRAVGARGVDGLELFIQRQRKLDRRHGVAEMGGRKRHGTYIILGEQVEGAEELVVLEIKRPCGLEVAAEGKQGRRLYNKLLWGPYLAELLVVLGGRDPGRPPRPAAVVGVVVVVVVGIEVWLMVLRSVAKHGCDGGGRVGDGRALRRAGSVVGEEGCGEWQPKQRRGVGYSEAAASSGGRQRGRAAGGRGGRRGAAGVVAEGEEGYYRGQKSAAMEV